MDFGTILLNYFVTCIEYWFRFYAATFDDAKFFDRTTANSTKITWNLLCRNFSDLFRFFSLPDQYLHWFFGFDAFDARFISETCFRNFLLFDDLIKTQARRIHIY